MTDLPGQRYLIRDPQGNVYGPADAAMLRAWVREGRIIPGMGVAPQETREWVDAADHPVTAALVDERRRQVLAAEAPDVPPPDPPPAPPSAENRPPPDGSRADRPTRDEAVLARAAQRIGVSPDVLRDLRPGHPPASVQVGYGYQPLRKHPLGLASFIVGTVALIPSCCFCFMGVPGLLGVVAVVLGAVALHQMKQSPTTYEPSNFPITGIVLGALAALISFGLLTATVINAIRSHP